MQQPHKWIWGFLVVAILWLLVGIFQTKTVEQDLSSRTQTAVASEGLLTPEMSVKGRDLTVSGTRLTDNQAQITSTLDAVKGVRLVRDKTTLIEEAKPYNWTLTRDAEQVVLAGHVPNPDVRAGIVSTINKFTTSAKVTDQATYARGNSGSLAKLAEVSYPVIAPLAKGRIDVTDGIVSISGEAATPEAYNSAVSALQSVPKDMLAKVDILAPSASPYVFTADKKDNQLMLTGFYPDEKTHAAWLDQAKQRFFGISVIDKLQLARGEPQDFSQAAIYGLGQLSRLEMGTLMLSDSTFKLTGVAMYEKAVDQIKGTLANQLPKDITSQVDLTVKQTLATSLDAQSCQTQMAGVMKSGRILFETGKSTIDTVSQGVLDSIVYLADNCPNTKISITGHTDNVGTAEDNLALSKQRALAVADYLVDSGGILRDRIEAIGLGQTAPVASNDTEEGKALNRRIEFTVK